MPDLIRSSMPSCSTSVKAVRFSNGPCCKPAITALATLPTPDCSGSRFCRQPALLHLVVEEVEDVAGDGARGGVGRGEGRVAVGRVGLDDRDDLLRIADEVRLADAIAAA